MWINLVSIQDFHHVATLRATTLHEVGQHLGEAHAASNFPPIFSEFTRVEMRAHIRQTAQREIGSGGDRDSREARVPMIELVLLRQRLERGEHRGWRAARRYVLE